MAVNTDSTSRRSMHAAGEGAPLKVPGCGLLVRHVFSSNQDSYRHGATGVELDRMTVREVSMLRLMEALTDKIDWSTKVFDKEVTEKWRKEALDMPWITEKTWDWCLKELQDKAKEYDATKRVTVLDMGSRCIKADNLVPADLQNALKSAVQPLLDQKTKDWHPGSNERVLNLVHPSLYHAVYGKTRVLRQKQIGLDKCLAPHDDCSLLTPPDPSEVEEDDSLKVFTQDDFTPDPQDDKLWSTKFQWLPCDVSFTNDTDRSVQIESYINNLHPDKHRSLYSIIESFITLSVPAWNEVLFNGESKGRTPIRIKVMGAETDPSGPPDWANEIDYPVDEGNEAVMAKINEYLALPDNLDNEAFFQEWDEGAAAEYDKGIEWKWRRLRKIIHPEPGVPPSSSYEDWKAGKITELGGRQTRRGRPVDKTRQFDYQTIDIRKTFAESGLQIIVKLASIELTPDNPSYDGGNWHLEGMLNEHIAATSLYYYDVENITESRIRFRQEAYLDSSEVQYPQSDHGPLCQLFGTDNLRYEPMVQELGSIATPDGRLLVFPNTLQHKVEPFTLRDPTKPGHRRFLVLWLVDPHYRILSTGNVPPQQHEWWAEKAGESLQGKVSAEIQKMIEDQLKDGTMTLEEAKEYRLQLMAERTSFVDASEACATDYNFCEH